MVMLETNVNTEIISEKSKLDLFISQSSDSNSIDSFSSAFLYPYNHKYDSNVFLCLLKNDLNFNLNQVNIFDLKNEQASNLNENEDDEKEKKDYEDKDYENKWNFIMTKALEMLKNELLLLFKIASSPINYRLRNKNLSLQEFLNSKSKLDMKSTQEKGIDLYLFLSNVLRIEKFSKNSLKDETYIFTSRMIYAKMFTLSLANQIESFVLSSKIFKKEDESSQLDQINQITSFNQKVNSKKLKSMTITRTYQLLSLDYYTDNNLLNTIMRTNSRIMLDIFLDELVFTSVDIIRVILIFYTLQCEKNSNYFNLKWRSALYKLSQIDQAKNWTNGKTKSMIKLKLTKLIEKMVLMEVIDKSKSSNDFIISLTKEVWDGLKTITQLLTEDKFSYLAEVRFIDRWTLHLSATFIARKYFKKLFIVLVSILINFLIHYYEKSLVTWEKSVKFLKTKIDLLIDTAFSFHLKDDIFSIISTIDGMDHIQEPDWGEYLDQKLTYQNIYQLVSKIIALIKFKLIKGKNFPSPLYTHLVKTFKQDDNTQNYLIKEKIKGQAESELENFLEKEIPFVYANLNIKLNCLAKVDQLGSYIAHDLGMKNSCKADFPIDNLKLLHSSYTNEKSSY